MSDPIRARNQLALVVLVTGKLFGIGGVVLNYLGQRTLGAVMLGFAGVCIVFVMVLCARNMGRRAKEDHSHKQALAEMIREGTLDQYLHELKAETRGEPTRDDGKAFS